MKAILKLHVASSPNLQLLGFAPEALKKDPSPPCTAAHYTAVVPSARSALPGPCFSAGTNVTARQVH